MSEVPSEYIFLLKYGRHPFIGDLDDDESRRSFQAFEFPRDQTV